ncbi:peroxidase-like [Bradysia coprophila]|uniref:peroxidase-like n=1 Tax=Bradysia coprophila TaxID=38358 RepID=UPI00187DB11D|nr:peroxidase-like [Bradysia coprophila]
MIWLIFLSLFLRATTAQNHAHRNVRIHSESRSSSHSSSHSSSRSSSHIHSHIHSHSSSSHSNSRAHSHGDKPNHMANQCRLMQRNYNQAAQKSQFLAETESTVKLVQRHDIGNNFFIQNPTPAAAAIDFNRTTTLLMAEQIYCANSEEGKCRRDTLKRLSSCIPNEKRCSTIPIEKLPKDKRFRTITGAWNNLKNPKWGKSFTPYGHLRPTNFADGIWEMRKSVTGEDLPGARVATNAIDNDPFTCTPEFPANFGSVMFGQLMAHDHGMRQMYQSIDGGPTRTCCNEDYSAALSPQPFACHAIDYPENDPFLKVASENCNNIGCMNYIRSQATFSNDCNLDSLQAVNQVSHYLDLSPVYGNTEEIASELRTFKYGLLKNNKNKVLPETCDDPTIDCYLTGDFRGTAMYFLGILQSMYHRFHNVVAPQLNTLYPKWDDERLYQETRRIVIACYQNHAIDWLRVFAGKNETMKFRPVGNNYVGRYNEKVDASSTVEFSHCVFRVYHSNLADKVHFMDANNTIIKTINLEDNDVGLKPLETHYNVIAQGMFGTGAGHASFTPTVRNKMFNNDNECHLGLDLISTDLLIGRDLGLQPFYVYFEQCTGKKVTSWDDLNTLPAKALADLKNVYKSVFDVDAFAGLALEEKCGSYLGTVGKCLVVKQYERTISGDRFFYSLSGGAYPFTRNQLDTIYKFSFANLICTVTELEKVPASAFEFPTIKNPMVACQRGIDLSAWRGLS